MTQDEWDLEDKILFGITTGLLVIDYSQTKYIYNHEGYYENNPIISWGTDRFDEKFIPFYFGASIAGSWIITDKLSPRLRKLFLGILIAVQTVVIGDNYFIGVGFSF